MENLLEVVGYPLSLSMKIRGLATKTIYYRLQEEREEKNA